MKKSIDCHKAYVEAAPHGLGVFADVDLEEGEVVEVGVMYRLNNGDGNENPHLFTWSDDRKTWAGGSGCLPFYNHSDEPNIKKIGDLPNDNMEIIALRNINKGEELLSKYFSSEWRSCFKNLL